MQHIGALYEKAMTYSKFVLTIPEIELLAAELQTIEQNRSICQEILGATVIIGDIHGMITDFEEYLRDFESSQIVLLGDLVDRGPSSYECFFLGILRYLCFSSKTVYLRGNHETAEMTLNSEKTSENTLLSDIMIKYEADKQQEVCELCAEMFNYLPIFAVVNKRFLCVHGCLPSFLSDFNSTIQQKLPLSIPRYFNENDGQGLLYYMALWCDPVSDDIFNDESNTANMITYEAHKYTVVLNKNRAESGELTAYSHVCEQLDKFGFSALFRGHVEVKGINLSPNGRIFTLQGHTHGYYAYEPEHTGSILVEVLNEKDFILHYY